MASLLGQYQPPCTRTILLEHDGEDPRLDLAHMSRGIPASHFDKDTDMRLRDLGKRLLS